MHTLQKIKAWINQTLHFCFSVLQQSATIQIPADLTHFIKPYPYLTSPWDIRCCPVKATASNSVDYYNVTSIYFLMLHPLAGIWGLYTLSMAVLLYSYSLHHRVLKSCLVLNPYWTDLRQDVFQTCYRAGWQALSRVKTVTQERKVSLQTSTHTLQSECTCFFIFERMPLWSRLSTWSAGSSSNRMAHFPLFHRGREIVSGYQGRGLFK